MLRFGLTAMNGEDRAESLETPNEAH
jgi:hypothetical protein